MYHIYLYIFGLSYWSFWFVVWIWTASILLRIFTSVFFRDICRFLFVVVFWLSLTVFRVKLMVSALKHFKKFPPCQLFWTVWEAMKIFFKNLVEYNNEAIWLWALFFRMVIITNSISVMFLSLHRFDTPSSLYFCRLCMSKYVFVPSILSNLLLYSCNNSRWWFLFLLPT